MKPFAVITVLFLSTQLSAQHAEVREAPWIDMPSQVDSNSPAYWRGGQLHLLNSTGSAPVAAAGADQFNLGSPSAISFNHINPWPTWLEATWMSPKGTIYAWYHQEHWGVCGNLSRLAVPQIGAAVSHDGGQTFYDLGAILVSGDATNCAAQNGYFAGGHGDFSVMLDSDHKYFYFLFTNYAGPLETQGVCIARMPFANRAAPAGTVMKWFNGDWSEPGMHGRTTPILPAKASWYDDNTDSFWGPSIHWNTHLESYVILLNRSCCTTGFPQKGIYASYSTKLDDPTSWTKPEKVVADTGWYPQVLGEESDGTDSVAGRVARLWIWGHSHREIVFHKPKPPDDPATPGQ